MACLELSLLILRASTLAWEGNDNRGLGQGLEAKEILGLKRARARLGHAKGLGTGVSTTRPKVGTAADRVKAVNKSVSTCLVAVKRVAKC